MEIKETFLSAKHLLPEDEGSVCGIHNLRLETRSIDILRFWYIISPVYNRMLRLRTGHL